MLRLQRVLKSIMQKNIRMREETSLDECAELQVRECLIALENFKSNYSIESPDDKILAMKITKYSRNLNKGDELLDQSALFDEISKNSFV